MSKRFFGLIISMAAVLLSSAVAYAQSASSAAILGRLTDPQGAVIAGATVTAKNLDTGIERTTKSTTDGFYRFENLPPGRYDVSASAPNFAKIFARGVHLNVGDVRDVNFSMVVAGTTTVVEVTSEAPLLESTRTELSTVINEADMARLPMSGAFSVGGTSGVNGDMNDYASLAATAPGVRFDFTSVSADLVGPGAYNNRDSIYNIDGGNIRDQVTSGRDALGASIDEIKEFQVLTNNYNAEYGQAGGLILNAITKSGTNSIHGDFHFFARGRNLEASSYFYNLGLVQHQGTPSDVCPPTNRIGDLTGCPRAKFFKHETGFTLGGPFVKDKTFWFVSYEKLLEGKPLTLTPPTGPVTVDQPDDEVMWSVKLDHHLTENHTFTARFNEQRGRLDNQEIQTGNNITPDALVTSVFHDHTLNGTWTATLTPHLTNEMRVFWHRYLNGLPTKSALPALSGPNFYEHAAFCCPQGGNQNRYQGIDNLTWLHGAHTLKTGVNFSYFPYFSLFQQVHFGRWKFKHSFPPTDFTGANPPTAFDFGEGPGAVHAKDNIYGWYVQDTWKLRPSLTLNYGLRWDYEAGAFRGGYTPINGDFANGCLMANGLIPACSSDKNNFQPRVGLAWSPNFESGPLHGLFGGPNKSLLTAAFAEMTQLAYLNISLDSLNFDGVTLVTGALPNSTCPLSVIAPFYPNFPPSSVLGSCFPATGSFGRVRPISNQLHNPEVRHVAATWQRELGRDAVLDVEYVGAFGFGQFGETDTNAPIVIADPAHPGYFYFGARPNPSFTAVRTNQNTRTSSYNGLIVDVKKRLSHHFQVHGGYTYSHTIASTEDFFGVSEPADWRTLAGERTEAQIDMRHLGNVGGIIDTEKLTSIPGIRHLFNDWQFGITSTLQTGRPWPISTGTVPFADALFFGIQNESVQRPNVLPDGTLSSVGIADAFGSNNLLGPGAVANCVTAGFSATQCSSIQNTFLAPAGASPRGAVDALTGEVVDFKQVSGNLKRNAGVTNRFYRTDFSITRTFRIPWREGIRVEARGDFFNVFNHPNFLLFGNAPNTTNFALSFDPKTGIPNSDFFTCTACMRPNGNFIGTGGQVLTLQALQHGRVSPGLGNPIFLGMGDPGNTDIPRQIQLSLRVHF